MASAADGLLDVAGCVIVAAMATGVVVRRRRGFLSLLRTLALALLFERLQLRRDRLVNELSEEIVSLAHDLPLTVHLLSSAEALLASVAGDNFAGLQLIGLGNLSDVILKV